jgi:hypothetical protein
MRSCVRFDGIPLVLILSLTLVACIPVGFDETPVGIFEGQIRLTWLYENHFLYEPHEDPQQRFRFIRANGQVIEPGTMVTNGASIPSLFWGAASLNPWTYAPAYLLHDWLFRARACGFIDPDEFTFEDTALIMAEALKTQMVTDPASRNVRTYELVAQSTATPIAWLLYDHLPCVPLPDGIGASGGAPTRGGQRPQTRRGPPTARPRASPPPSRPA